MRHGARPAAARNPGPATLGPPAEDEWEPRPSPQLTASRRLRSCSRLRASSLCWSSTDWGWELWACGAGGGGGSWRCCSWRRRASSWARRACSRASSSSRLLGGQRRVSLRPMARPPMPARSPPTSCAPVAAAPSPSLHARPALSGPSPALPSPGQPGGTARSCRSMTWLWRTGWWGASALG